MWRRCFKRTSVLFESWRNRFNVTAEDTTVDQIFVSHAHIDHFIGFDHLLSFACGTREDSTPLRPAGFAERVYHKLQAYRWNLVEKLRLRSCLPL